MYCYNCGKEIEETMKFCPYCGAEQKQPQQSPQWQQPQHPTQQPTQWQQPPAANNSEKNNSWQSRLPIILAVAALVIVALLAVRAFHNSTDAQNELKAIATTEPVAAKAAPAETEPPAPTETQALTDGWHTINGKRYYIQDGEKYVDLQEIDNALYYFDEDGALAENEDVDYYGATLHAGRDGIIEGITYDEIWGSWSDERYSFGNGGHSSIIEFTSEIENCDSFQFCLEAGGLHGAKVNGTWKVYIRCNGNWEFVRDINYTEPNGYFDIKLNGYKSFDAITAYPTVRGNATYSASFYLQNVHCTL